MFLREDQEDSIMDLKSQKKLDITAFSNVSLFPSRDAHSLSYNIFNSFPKPGEKNSEISKSQNNEQSTLKMSDTNPLMKNRFENQSFSIFDSNIENKFKLQPISLPNFTFTKELKKESSFFPPFSGIQSNISNTFGETSCLQTKLNDSKLQDSLKVNVKNLFEEQTENKKKQEERHPKLILGEEKVRKENYHMVIEKEEKKTLEKADKRKENFEKQENKEKVWQDKLREEKELAELKKQEEEKRTAELEYKRKFDAKILHLKIKMEKWKTKIIFEKWRMITWSKIEERRMKEYFKELKIKYPPVCSEESLGGNPYGLLIPSILTLEKFRIWPKVNKEPSKKLLIISQDLPLIKVDLILGKLLEDFAKSLKVKNTCSFPWKVIISVPDKSESPDYWKSIETFVEMHFVKNFQWEFGIQKGPLYCTDSGRGSFQFKISIRRLRGVKMYEGIETNPLATIGSNALIFFVTEKANKITRDRLKVVLMSRAPLPKIPVVVVALNSQCNEDDLNKFLDLKVLQKSYISSVHIIPIIEGKHQLVEEFIKSLKLAVVFSAPPSYLKVSRISTFFTKTWLDFIWRRAEISLSNFRILLEDPKILIEFYNSCLDVLKEIFLDSNYDEQTVLGQEFHEFYDKPKRTEDYIKKITAFLNKLKLPHWPRVIPKSLQQLNYQIHEYCKKIVGQNKIKLKCLKWNLFNVIRRFLLWKDLNIYCDEDINQILVNFPWVQVFQEISSFQISQLNESIEGEKDLTVIYNTIKIENMNFEPALIDKIFKKKQFSGEVSKATDEEFEKWDPKLENDSIIYAYSVALKCHPSKRKREECVNDSSEVLFSDHAEKRLYLEKGETKNFDLAAVDSNFQNLDDQLNKIKEQMSENSKMLIDILREIQ